MNANHTFKYNHVVVHPFSSQKKKTWKPFKWAEIIFKILNNNSDISISIIGAKEDFKNAVLITNNELLSKFKDRIMNKAGKTTLEQLFNYIEKCDLLIGHDSMAGHIASICNTQSLTISLGTVRPDETTPFFENNYNIAPNLSCFPCAIDTDCDNYQCHDKIPSQAVASAVEALISQKKIDTSFLKTNKLFTNQFKIYKSTFSNQGLFKLVNISMQDSSISEVFKIIYRICWLHLIPEIEENTQFPKIDKKVAKELQSYIKGVTHLFELFEFGKKYTKFIIEEFQLPRPGLENIKAHSTKIDEINELLTKIQSSFPMLSPLIKYSQITLSNITGNTIPQMAQNSFYSYQDSGLACRIVYELIKTIFERNNIILANNIQQSDF